MSRSLVRASRTPGSSRGARRRVAAAIGALALVVLAGCAGSSSDSASTSGGSAQSGSTEARPAAGTPFAASDSAGQSTDSLSPAAAGGAAPLTTRRQIRTGALTVAVPDVADGIITVRRIAATAKGFVADEQTTTGMRPEPVTSSGREPASGPTPTGVQTGQADSVIVNRSVLTVRVPEQSLEQVMDQVANVGTLRARSQASQDVTDTYVDTATRLRTQRESVARVQALLSKATTISDIVKVEGELSKRQADLESLEARLAALDDSTTLATLTVDLVPDGAAVRAAAAPRQGFVGGLQSGWHALTVTVVTGSRAVGALLPFLVPLGIVAVPIVMTLRRRRSRTPEPAA